MTPAELVLALLAELQDVGMVLVTLQELECTPLKWKPLMIALI